MGLEEALVELEGKLQIRPPFGANHVPPTRRFAAVLIMVRDKICPAYKKIEPRSKATRLI